MHAEAIIDSMVLYLFITIPISTIAYVLGTVLCGIFYHLGGMGGAWWKSSWVRDWICPLVVLAVMQWTHVWHWSLLWCYVLMIMALSTYWKELNPLFKKPTTDCFWFNWMAHGFGVGLAMLPYGYYMHCMEQVFIRAFVLGVAMVIWSSVIIKIVNRKKTRLGVAWDEWGRGAEIVATLPII